MSTAYTQWQLAARRMVAEACEAERIKVRGNRKRHVPYRIPEWIRPLLDAVERDDEFETKRIMLVVRAGAFTLV